MVKEPFFALVPGNNQLVDVSWRAIVCVDYSMFPVLIIGLRFCTDILVQNHSR